MTIKNITTYLVSFICLFFSTINAQDFAIKAKKIITMTGKVIENGIILIRDGKIEKIGSARIIKIPITARVLNASKFIAMPAFVLAHTSQGMDRRNENMPVVPFISAKDGLNPVDPFFEDLRRGGYGAVHVIPGNNCILGGTGIVVKPFGLSIKEMLIADMKIQKISLSKSGIGRIKAVDMLWKAFADMEMEIKEKKEKIKEEREEALALGKKTKIEKEPLFPEEKENLKNLVTGKGRAFFYCRTKEDILEAVALKERYKINMSLVLTNACWKYTAIIKRHNLRVILEPNMVYEEKDPLTKETKRICPAYQMYKAGIEFALTTTYGSSLPERYPLWQAAEAVKWGVPKDVALSSITAMPAKILGLQNRIGTLKPGMDANIVLLSGDPLDYRTWVERVIVQGETIYEKTKDPVFKNLLKKEGKK